MTRIDLLYIFRDMDLKLKQAHIVTFELKKVSLRNDHIYYINIFFFVTLFFQTHYLLKKELTNQYNSRQRELHQQMNVRGLIRAGAAFCMSQFLCNSLRFSSCNSFDVFVKYIPMLY